MITLSKTSLSLSLNGFTQSEFNFAWLRDNCSCESCLNPNTQERTLITSEIPDNISPIASAVEKNQLLIMWNDKQHQSKYSFDWLSQHKPNNNQDSLIRTYNDPANGEMKLWGKELETLIPTFSYTELHEDNSALLAWCEAIRDLGLAIIRDAPTVESEVERFADYVGVVRETLFGRIRNIRATPNTCDNTSPDLELKPHTDLPNYIDPPSVLMYHFLVNNEESGISTAVDGFKVAQQFKEQEPKAFKTLTKIAVPFRINSGRGDFLSANPLLTLDTAGNLKAIRFSNKLAQAMNLSMKKMDKFYRAYRLLGKIIEEPKNIVKFRLNTGDMMTTNNLRVLHGRKSYHMNSAESHCQLAYMDFDDVLSRIRMIKKLKT